MKKFIFSVAAVILAAVAVSAQQMQPIPIDPAVRIGKLDNGLTYYIRHHEEPKGQANFYIAQKVGSILEDEDQRGLAHFLEHMCFNGTQHFPGNGVIRYCESIGVKFGANLNAYTSIDETVYNIDNVPVGEKPVAIDSCLWILHDWADGLLLTGEDIDHERGVIHEEWRTRASAQVRMMEKIRPVIYADGNRYGHRLPIGLMSVVDNFPYKAIRDYYEKWYRPDLQGIVVVGDIDPDAIEAKIKDIFNTIQAPVNPAERTYFEVPDNKEPIICLATDKEQPYAITMLGLKHEPYPVQMRGDVNYLIYEYCRNAAIIMLNERLQELLQSPTPPFIQAMADDGDFFIAKTKKSLGVTIVSSEKDITTAATVAYRELLRAVRNGFTASEYERAKAQILTQLESEYKSCDKKKSAEYCREYVRHFIDNEPIAGEKNMLDFANQISGFINVDMVSKVFSSLVGKDNFVLYAMLPEKEGLVYPTEKELAAAVAAVEAENIEPYAETVSNEPILSQLPAKGRILKAKKADFGYTCYKLSNGATVYFRQTDFNKDEVLMSANSFGGTSLYPVEISLKKDVLDDIIDIGGLGNFSKTELTKALAGKKVNVYPHIRLLGESINSSSTPKDIETMFQLNYLYFTDIRSDKDAFQSWLTRTASVLENREKNPMSAVQDSLSSSIYVNKAALAPIKRSDIDSVDYEKSLKAVRERFSNANDFVFVITGAVDEATVRPLIEQYIASLPSGKREKANVKIVDYTSGKVINNFEREMEVPMATNVFFDNAKIKYNLKNKLSYNLALHALSIVLNDEIREKEGGTYGIGAYGEMSDNPSSVREAFMQIVYQTNPEKYEYLNGRVRDIVAQFVKEGPSEENLTKGKEYFLKNYKENLSENEFWGDELYELLVTGVDHVTNYEAVLKSITKEDVRKALADVLAKGNHAEIIMVGKTK
ncbi:MAG: insulinase family protein [Bacteroidales bacterium]|nr:insulinase family protein [Bacteroidales bacterium]